MLVWGPEGLRSLRSRGEVCGRDRGSFSITIWTAPCGQPLTSPEPAPETCCRTPSSWRGTCVGKPRAWALGSDRIKSQLCQLVV